MKAGKRIDPDPEANDELAAESYRFYAREASEFVQASAQAVAEAFEYIGSKQAVAHNELITQRLKDSAKKGMSYGQ
jgi:hypothetical protein